MASRKKKGRRKLGYYADTSIAIGTVAETETTPEVKFTYRPLSYAERVRVEALQSAIDVTTPEGYEEFSRVTVGVIPSNLISWNLKRPKDLADPDGELVTVDFRDEAELDRVASYILEKVADVVLAEPKGLSDDALKN